MQLRNLPTWPWLFVAIVLAMACLAAADDDVVQLYSGVPFRRAELEQMIGEPLQVAPAIKISGVLAHVENDVLMAIEFDVTEQDVAGPHPKRRYRNDPCIRLKIQDWRETPYDKSHGRALSLTLEKKRTRDKPSENKPDPEDSSNVHTTLNLWPATPYCNRELMREVERYIEWAAPVRVKITAQYDGKAPFIGDRVEVPDAFVYEITNKKLQSRFFVPNIEAPLARAAND